MNGVPAVVVERASRLGRLMVKGEDLVSVCAGVASADGEDLERAEWVARGFGTWSLDAVEGGPEEDDLRGMLEELLEELLEEGATGHRGGRGETDVDTGTGTEMGLESRSGTMSRHLS